jgi:hypothetical protein
MPDSMSRAAVPPGLSPPVRAATSRTEAIVKPSALLDVLALAFVAGLAVLLWVLFAEGGWEYYRTPVRVRGYSPVHSVLRPSGPGGNLAGLGGTIFMMGTLLYVLRKKVKAFSRLGSMKAWLEFHIFCGLFGPILVTIHTSFKFNGIISVAYWSMILVVLSGFVGRYLYVRIPKTIRGNELSRAELEERVRDMKERLAESTISLPMLARLEAAERDLLPSGAPQSFFGGLVARLRAQLRVRALRREIRASGLNRQLLHEVLDAVHERALLLSRIASLDKTRRLFEMWHIFHRPLVWVLFIVFALHLAVALYFGYTLFGR